jgi:hypothetical protein
VLAESIVKAMRHWLDTDLKTKRRITAAGPFAIAALCALFVIMTARHSKSPLLFVVIFGGLFVLVPVLVGFGVLTGRLRVRGETENM